MISWTTPTLPILVTGGNLLADNVDVYFTLKQGCETLTLKPESMTATDEGVLCELHFTQIQSGKLQAGAAKIQCNAVDSSGFRAASVFKNINIGSNLIPEVLNYGG